MLQSAVIYEFICMHNVTGICVIYEITIIYVINNWLCHI